MDKRSISDLWEEKDNISLCAVLHRLKRELARRQQKLKNWLSSVITEYRPGVREKRISPSKSKSAKGLVQVKSKSRALRPKSDLSPSPDLDLPISGPDIRMVTVARCDLFLVRVKLSIDEKRREHVTCETHQNEYRQWVR